MIDAEALREFRFLDEIGRYDYFLGLYGSDEPADERKLEAMYRSPDPLVRLILLKYLAEIPEKKAVAPIIEMIQEANPVVARAAMSAYQHNHYPAKPKLLKPLILSRDEAACRFAVRTLSRAGYEDAYPLILREIPEREDPVLSEMIIALRFLPDARTVGVLEPLTRAKSEKIRFLAVQTLAGLQLRQKVLPPSFFLAMSQDPSLRVRRLALEALQGRSSPQITAVLIGKVLDRGEDDSLRERAIRALAAVPSTDVVAPLIRVLCGDDPASLKLAAEITLKGLPPRVAKGGLVRQLDAAAVAHRRRAAVLLAQFFGNDPGVRRILLELWKSADDETRVELSEMLRELGGADAEALLIEAMGGAPLVAYASAGALARILGHGSGPRVLAMLKDSRTSSQAKQALLAHWVRRAPDEGVRADLLPWLLETLQDDVLNHRYLALQVLGWFPLAPKLSGLVDLLTREASADVVRAVHRQLSQDLGDDPTPLVAAVEAHPRRSVLIGHMVRILADRSWDPAVCLPLLDRLACGPLNLLTDNLEAFVAVCAHMIERRCVLLQTVWILLGTEARHERLLETLLSFARNPRRSFPSLPIPFLELQLRGEGPWFRRIFYELLEADGRKEAAEAIAAALVHEEDVACASAGAAALRRMIVGSRA